MNIDLNKPVYCGAELITDLKLHNWDIGGACIRSGNRTWALDGSSFWAYPDLTNDPPAKAGDPVVTRDGRPDKQELDNGSSKVKEGLAPEEHIDDIINPQIEKLKHGKV